MLPLAGETCVTWEPEFGVCDFWPPLNGDGERGVGLMPKGVYHRPLYQLDHTPPSLRPDLLDVFWICGRELSALSWDRHCRQA